MRCRCRNRTYPSSAPADPASTGFSLLSVIIPTSAGPRGFPVAPTPWTGASRRYGRRSTIGRRKGTWRRTSTRSRTTAILPGPRRRWSVVAFSIALFILVIWSVKRRPVLRSLFLEVYQEEVEVEMRRLKLELKQTMDMYSTACKEALTAKQKVLWSWQQCIRLGGGSFGR